MSHYFTNENTPWEPCEVRFYFKGEPESFMSNAGVFSKDGLDYGTRVLLETLLEEDLKGEVLDLGCGAGYIGVLLKKYDPQLSITMVDINETAVELAKINSERYGQSNTVANMDGISSLTQSFDVIVTNPPIRTGKKNVYRLFEEAYQHLNEDGRLFVVIRKQQGAESALKYLQTLGVCNVVNKSNGYWVLCLKKSFDKLTIES